MRKFLGENMFEKKACFGKLFSKEIKRLTQRANTAFKSLWSKHR